MCYCSTQAGAWALNDESESGVIQGLMTVSSSATSAPLRDATLPKAGTSRRGAKVEIQSTPKTGLRFLYMYNCNKNGWCFPSPPGQIFRQIFSVILGARFWFLRPAERDAPCFTFNGVRGSEVDPVTACYLPSEPIPAADVDKEIRRLIVKPPAETRTDFPV